MHMYIDMKQVVNNMYCIISRPITWEEVINNA